MNKKIQKLIKNVDVVSFDIFDTLLFRPYVRPIDLFLHIERHYNAPFFMTCRVGAEQNARQKNSTKQDITFDEIYDEIDPCFQHLKQVELDWERMVLRPNPEMKAIWDFARENGKKIVVASDMYLPTEFIADVLNKNGFGGYDRLYVSGDINQTKARGTLFDTIIHDMGVAPKKILHIGDSKKSDYKRPREHGLRAYLYPHLVKTWLKNNVRMSKFYRKQDDNLGASILVAIMSMRDQAERMGMAIAKNYWEKLGYEYGGPVIYGYTRWIEQTAQNQGIDHLMFVARDGYTLQRVFNTFNDTIKNSYIYAPRFLNLICRLDYWKNDIKQSGAIIEYFRTKDTRIEKMARTAVLQKWSDYHDFIQNNIDIFGELAGIERDNYKSYLLKNAGATDKIGVVDTITARFSSQKLIQDVIGDTTPAFYWSVLKGAYEGVYKYNQLIENNREIKYVFTKNWNFMEFLMTAPEYPIKNLTSDGQPVYDPHPTDAEKFRREIYPDVSNGAVDFANDIKQWFNGANIYLNGETLVRWVNCLCDNPTKTDHKNMAKIKHAYDSAHSIYQPLFSVNIPLSYAIKHPKRAIKLARHAMWKTPMQTIITCLTTPIKIRMHGLKQIRIHIFPHLQYRYVNFVVRFTRKCFYQVCVGKPQEIKS